MQQTHRQKLIAAALITLTLGCRAPLPTGSASAPAWQPAADSRLAVHRNYDETGPLHLMTTYRCDPARRGDLEAYLAGPAASRLAAWHREGLLADYEVFFNTYVDEVTYDAMILLRFADYEGVARWNDIERELPGGLDAAGHALATPTVTSSADVVWANPGEASPGTEHAASDSVFLMIPYDYLGLVAEYKEYVDGYVIPQLEGWLNSDVLRTYRVALNRFPTGDRWMAYLWLEYRNHDAFGKRKQTKNNVREYLREDAVWMDLSARKRTIRSEREPVICRCIATSRKD